MCKNKVPWSMEPENVVVGFACDLVFQFCCTDPTSFALPLPIFVFAPYHSFARTGVEPPLEMPRMGPWSSDFCLHFHWPLVVAQAVPTSRLHHHIFQQSNIYRIIFSTTKNIYTLLYISNNPNKPKLGRFKMVLIRFKQNL